MSVEFIEHNTSFKKPAMLVLATCKDPDFATRGDVEAAVAEQWDAEWNHSPADTVEFLLAAKALDEEVTVDGEPYDGTLENIQLDLSVDESADVVARMQITEVGQQVLDDYAPAHTVAELLASKPAYHDVFRAVLEACTPDEGCTLPDLESAIEGFPQLKPDPQTHQTKVYPQYFIDALETAGAIEWTDSWRITQAGKEALSA